MEEPITYLECHEGDSEKFWSVRRQGKALHVHWGRIDTEGQKQVKQFPSPAAAMAELERLVAAKKKKGYVPPAIRVTPARAVKAPSDDEALEEVCASIEEFCPKLASVKGLEVQPAELEPVKASAIAAFEKKWRLQLPPEVKAFLRRGLRYAHGTAQGEALAYIGFDFISLEHMVSMKEIFRGLLVNYEEDEDEYPLLEHGVALSYSEPQLLVMCAPDPDKGSIYHFSPRNPVRAAVAGSLTEFLRDWLAAGCFSSRDFNALWPRVQPLVPVKRPHKQNRWLRYYDAQFKTKYAR